jgi:hypothetical protein
MDNWWQHRLTVLGSAEQLRRFRKSHWNTRLQAQHIDLLENSPSRMAWQFDSTGPLVEPLRALSRRWPGIVILLDYEAEDEGIKGLLKAQAGRIAFCQFEY